MAQACRGGPLGRGPVMNAEELRRVVDGRWADVRQEVRRQVPPEWCQPMGDLDREAHRSMILERTKVLADGGLPGRGFEKATAGRTTSAARSPRRDARRRRPVADGQGRRAVGAVRRRGAGARHRAAPRPVPARDHGLRAARLLRDDRDRSRLRRPAAADDRDLRRGDAASSSCTRPTPPPARTTSATRRGTAGWRSCSPSSSPAARARRARAAGADPDDDGQPCPACESRTAATRPGSTASTTGG